MISAWRTIEAAYKKARQWSGEIENGNSLSPSRITNFKICGLAWYFRYISKIKTPPAGRMAFGFSGHAALTTDLTVKKDTGDVVKDSLLAELFDSTLDENFKHVDKKFEHEPLGKMKDEFREKGHRLLALYRRIGEPAIKPKEVEKRIEYPIEVAGLDNKPQIVQIVNHIDTVARGDKLIDFKFRGRANGHTDTPTLQMASYALAYKYETGREPKEVREDQYVALKREARLIPQRMDAIDPQARIALALDVQTVLRATQAGIFVTPARGRYPCTEKWCSYWNFCPYGGGGKKGMKLLPNGKRLALP
jgi:putative RecB family exonuclease